MHLETDRPTNTPTTKNAPHAIPPEDGRICKSKMLRDQVSSDYCRNATEYCSKERRSHRYTHSDFDGVQACPSLCPKGAQVPRWRHLRVARPGDGALAYKFFLGVLYLAITSLP
jgi:hypothetical protein